MADSTGEADDLQQLDRFLTQPGPPLRLGVVRVDDPRMIPRYVRELSGRHCIFILQLGREDDRVDLVERMRVASGGDALFVLGLERLLLDEFGLARVVPSVADLNMQRDVMPTRLAGRVVLWLPETAYPAYLEALRDLNEFLVFVVHLRERLADTWAPIRLYERCGALARSSDEQRATARKQRRMLSRMHGNASGLGAAEVAVDIAVASIALDDIEQARIWTERAVQSFVAQGRGDLGARELRRLGEAELSFGDDVRALALAERAVELARQANAGSELAHALGLRAELLAMRGDLEGAVELWQAEIGPLVEQLADPRERAWLADCSSLLALWRGELDDALEWREQQLSVMEPIADARTLAAARRRLADVLVARGELDRAEALVRDEVMPVFGRLDDARERALAWGTLADIRFEQGELDEARRIREQHQLPVFEQLGDVREIAVTWAKLGDVAWAREDEGEALRLLEQARAGFERVRDLEALARVDERLASMRAVASSTDRDDRADPR